MQSVGAMSAILVDPKIYFKTPAEVANSKWMRQHVLFICSCKQSELEYKGQHKRIAVKDLQAELPKSYIFKVESEDKEGSLYRFLQTYLKLK